MGMKIIVGRSGSGKTKAVLEAAAGRIRSDRETILIVPEQYSFQAERELVDAVDRPGILGSEVLSFSRLVHRVLETEGGLGLREIGDLGRIMLLRKVFEERRGQFGIFGGAFRKQGFLAELNGFLNELKKNAIEPEDLLAAADQIKGFGMLKEKVGDVVLAYGALEQRLESRYADTWDLYALAETKLGATDRYRETVFFVDGFAGFTGRELRLLKALVLGSEGVVVSLACDPRAQSDAHVFSNTLRTLSDLRGLAETVGAPLKVVELEPEKRTDALGHLRTAFYRYPTEVYRKELEAIRLFAAKNRYSEVENAAGEMLRLVAENRWRFRDLGVLCDMGIYGETLRRVFETYGIPYFIDRKRPVAGSALARYVLSALEVVRLRFRYEDVFGFLKTGLSGIDPETVERLENHVLAKGIRGSGWRTPFAAEDPEAAESLEAARESLWKRFDALGRALEEAETVRAHVKALEAFLKDEAVEERLEVFVEGLVASGAYEYASEYAQIWNLLMEIFGQLLEVGGEEPVDLKTFMDLLKTGFASSEVGIIPTTADQVLVGGLKRSRSHRVKALFVLGVNDRVLPSAVEESGILLDEELKVLQRMGLAITMDGDSRVDEERFALYNAFSRPESSMWFSYALADGEGKSLRPSLLVSRLRQLFPLLETESDQLEPRVDRVLRAPRAAYGHLVEALRRHLEEDRPLSPEEKALAAWFKDRPEFEGRLKNTRKALFHDNRTWNIDPELAERLYGTPLRVSSSRIERFYQCPFQHFVSYGLRPKEREKRELAPPDVGRLFHESVEGFTRRVNASGCDWSSLTPEQVDGFMEETLGELVEVWGGEILKSTERYRYFADRIGRVAHTAARTATEHVQKGVFRPAAVEAAFGEGKPLPPIELDLPGGKTVRLEGRIDRLDLHEDGEALYVKVIDYKSYDKPFRIDDACYGLEIQLPVYLAAALGRRTDKPIVPAGAFYFKIDDPVMEDPGLSEEALEAALKGRFKMKGVVLRDEKVIKFMDGTLEEGKASEVIPVKLKRDGSPGKTAGSMERKDLEVLLAHALRSVGKAAREMLEGGIRARPFRKGARSACAFCPFASICQFDPAFASCTYRTLGALQDAQAVERMAAELEEDEKKDEKGGKRRG